MIERLDDMPDGTIGFKVSGELTRDDYADVLVPALKAVLDAGGNLRQLYVIDGLKEMDPGAFWQDAKAGFDFEAHHRHALEKAAIVTDQEWLVKAVGLLGWMAPGDLRRFPLAQIAEARAWVAS